MAAELNPFKVLTTPAFERDFHKISRGQPSLVDATEELLTILRRDPHNRNGQYKIKKLAGSKAGEGQWRIRWKEYRLRYDILRERRGLVLVSAPEGRLLAASRARRSVMVICDRSIRHAPQS
jgi:mRNA-degrading endonuclease RelE of RelBE toxin-antitoxin system